MTETILLITSCSLMLVAIATLIYAIINYTRSK